MNGYNTQYDASNQRYSNGQNAVNNHKKSVNINDQMNGGDIYRHSDKKLIYSE